MLISPVAESCVKLPTRAPAAAPALSCASGSDSSVPPPPPPPPPPPWPISDSFSSCPDHVAGVGAVPSIIVGDPAAAAVTTVSYATLELRRVRRGACGSGSAEPPADGVASPLPPPPKLTPAGLLLPCVAGQLL